MQEMNDNAVKEIERLALAGMGPRTVDKGTVPYVLVPAGYTAKAMPELIFNEHSLTPERIRASVTVSDPESFVKYHGLFADVNSRVFADEVNLKVVGVLDYHAAGEGSPRWGQHRVTLALHKAEEWKRWIGHNNKVLTQTEFSEFLEQNSMDITAPSPASIVDVANDLQATTEVEFGSGIRQSDGKVKFKYTETTKTTVGAAEVTLPDRFTLQIPAFVGGKRVSIEALLRFRIKEGKLTFFYTLIRPEVVVRDAFLGATAQIATALSIEIINGTPAS